MLNAIEVTTFRGFKHLLVEDLGRVNLIVGRNDVGKSSLMLAASAAESPELSCARLLDHHTTPDTDFDAVWRPMFHDADLTVPFSVRSVGPDGPMKVTWRCVSKGGIPVELRVVVEGHDTTSTEHQLTFECVLTPSRDTPGNWWSNPGPDPMYGLIRRFTTLHQKGRDADIANRVRLMNPEVTRLDLVGERLWVRLRDRPLPLPFSALGDGSRRFVELVLATLDSPSIFIDEIENGFHHTTLHHVWQLLQTAAPETQIFATTHRDECVRAAIDTFAAAGDDGLRVIRLERHGDEHRAVVYPLATARAALEMDMELRG